MASPAVVLHDLAEEGKTWKVHFVFFARAGFTDAARIEAFAHQAILVDLETLDKDLHESG